MTAKSKAILAGILLILGARAGLAQTLVATDENMGFQLIELTNWNMGADELLDQNEQVFALNRTAEYSCGKLAAMTAFIHSDPVPATGHPEVLPFVRMRWMPDQPWEQGGSIFFKCFTDSPNYMYMELRHSRNPTPTQPNYGSIFWNSTRGPSPNAFKFSSTTARRGWIKVEYWR